MGLRPPIVATNRYSKLLDSKMSTLGADEIHNNGGRLAPGEDQ